MCIDGKPPFKSVLTHGFVVDADGRKMSKSLGNVISPFDIIKDYGADILRLWVASSDYNEDIRISKEILTRLSESYRKIRNTCRFILSNLYDFNPDTDKINIKDLRKLDKWILWRMQYHLLLPLENAFNNFEFYKAYKLIYDFCNEDLSMYYLDMAKGRLYTYAAGSIERRSAQTVIYEVLNCLVKVMAPIFVFTADEIWQHLPKEKKESLIGSVHLLEWPKAKIIEDDSDIQMIEQVFSLTSDVARALEDKRCAGVIGSSFDAQINLLTKSEERYKFLKNLKEELCEIFKVSAAEVTWEGGTEITVKVQKAQGAKCARCWNYSHSVGENQEHPSICGSCLKTIGGN